MAVVHISECNFHRFEEQVHAFEHKVVPVGRQTEQFPEARRVIREQGHGNLRIQETLRSSELYPHSGHFRLRWLVESRSLNNVSVAFGCYKAGFRIPFDYLLWPGSTFLRSFVVHFCKRYYRFFHINRWYCLYQRPIRIIFLDLLKVVWIVQTMFVKFHVLCVQADFALFVVD